MFLRYESLCFLPVDVEGQGAELGCRSNNIREKEPPSARVRENKRTQNHYQDDPKTKQNKDHNKSNAPKDMLLLETNKKRYIEHRIISHIIIQTLGHTFAII